MLRFDDRQSNPSGRQHTAELAMREECDVFAKAAKPRNEAVGAGRYLCSRLTARTTVAEDVPVGRGLSYFSSRKALVCAIVPFCEVRFDLGFVSKARERTCLAGASARTGQDTRERNGLQKRQQSAGLHLAVLGQGNVAATGMAA